MAAKAKAQAKNVKKPKAAANTKVKKKKTPTAGMDAKQLKAYTKAAKSVAAKQQVQKNANAYRARRLATAKRVTATQRAAYKSAAASRAVQYATQKTYNQLSSGHQSSYLRKSAAKRVFNATRIASSRKFVALGEATHAHQSRMQTVTNAQAVSMEQKLRAKALKTAARTASRKARLLKSLKKAGKVKKNATSLPKGYTVSTTGTPRLIKTKKKAAAKSKVAKARGGYSRQAVQAGLKAAQGVKKREQAAAKVAKAAQSKKKAAKPKAKPKAAVVTPVVNSNWITAGNDRGIENCLAVAIANHLLHWEGYELDDAQVWALDELCDDKTITVALHDLQHRSPWSNVRLAEVHYLGTYSGSGSLVGCTTKYGYHSGLALDEGVVSWGEILKDDVSIAESWYLRWQVT